MIKGWKTRFIFFLFFLFSLMGSGTGVAGVSYKFFDVSTGTQRSVPTTGRLEIEMYRYEIRAFVFRAIFFKRTNPVNLIWIKQYTDKPHYELPPFVENWHDQFDTLYASLDSLENTFVIRPLGKDTVTVDSFRIEAGIRHGLYPTDEKRAGYLTVIIRLKDPPFLPPTLVPEPLFTPGTQNTIQWIPSSQASTQDVYCFDTLDSLNLYKSIKRLYRVSSRDTLSAQFEGLQDGHRYGYFAKAVFGTGPNAITLYSDFTYSVQDHSPPPPVLQVQAVVQGTHTVQISWKTVEDGGSGTRLYQIYHSLDTGPEVLLDSVMASFPQPEFLTYYHWVPFRAGSHYRITAVDWVGNEGEGARTNPVFSNFNEMDSTFGGFSENSSSDQTPLALFLKGVIDTLYVPVSGLEKALRFQVVRDSASFFDAPPSLGGRFFDSGWIPIAQVPEYPQKPNTKFYTFDYTQGDMIPVSFVNGHRYIRRVIRQYLASTDTFELGEKIPDAFPPEDIRNVKVQAVLTEPTSVYSHWHFLVTWESSNDPVSGLKRYRIFRKVGQGAFSEIPLPDGFLKTHFIDYFEKVSSSFNNPLVFYRIVAEDHAGNCRDTTDAYCEAKDRALGAPLVNFADLYSADVKLKGVDTLYVRKETVSLQLQRFDLSDVDHFIVSLNDKETVYPKPPTDTLSILLPSEEKIEIRVRAVYGGGRSSVWSNSKVVIRTSNLPVQEISAWIDTSYWGGHIYLRWKRPSLDIKSYEIWRWSPAESPTIIGIIESDKDEVQWTDFYDLDERTGKPGEPLWAYQTYFYAIRKINLFNEVTPYSDTVSAWCNKPPTIQKADIGIENGKPVIRIRWRRALPTMVPRDFTIGVKVYRDSLDHLIVYDTIADDDSTYTFRAVEFGHNFIFQVQEIPNRDLPDRRSSWSCPFTVSLKTLSMAALAQPRGKIFLHWDTSILDSFKVNAFLLTRKSASDFFEIRVSRNIASYMDTDSHLIHGRVYQYYVMALDSLDQVVAANQAEVICDTGAAYIPFVEKFKMKYFNSDSICVKWVWRDVHGQLLENDTRGAKSLVIQVSVSKFFPDDTLQTRTIGPFPADPINRTRWVHIPKLGNRENATIYCRMTAKDAWGNPTEAIWSTDVHADQPPVAVFDPVAPKAVQEVIPKAVHAYPGLSNTVIHTLSWSGKGVEWPENEEGILWDKLDTNVAFYELWRMPETDASTFVRKVPVHHLREEYTVLDTVPNGLYRWKVVSVDSAGNRTEGRWSELSLFLSTPSSPVPFSSRGCQIVPVENFSNIEYFVEMALIKNHFRLAYEMDPDGLLDSLLCQSGWTKNLHFECKTGWGRVVRDTTWFRVKARIEENVESGWSEPVPYIASNTPNPSQRSAEKPICELGSNYPNPFNPTTTIPYQLALQTEVSLSIYNVLGERVRILVNGEREPGEYHEIWDATDESGIPVASGIYFGILKIETEKGKVLHRRIKMILMR